MKRICTRCRATELGRFEFSSRRFQFVFSRQKTFLAWPASCSPGDQCLGPRAQLAIRIKAAWRLGPLAQPSKHTRYAFPVSSAPRVPRTRRVHGARASSNIRSARTCQPRCCRVLSSRRVLCATVCAMTRKRSRRVQAGNANHPILGHALPGARAAEPPTPRLREIASLRSRQLAQARRIFPSAQPLGTYISELNASLPPSSPVVRLLLPTDESENPAYVRLIANLIIAWPETAPSPQPPSARTNPPTPRVPHVPLGAGEGLSARSVPVSLDGILARVISTVLTRHPDRFSAQAQNVLCNGFALGRPDGPGSVLRNLDSHAPACALNVLRSPPWRTLFARLGHVVTGHLLTHAALLVPVMAQPPGRPTADGSGREAVVLMQVCGPLARKDSGRIAMAEHSQGSTDIHLKRDVLYRSPVSVSCCGERRVCADGSTGSTSKRPEKRQRRAVAASTNETNGKTGQVILGKSDSCLNAGLPSAHPIQSLLPDSRGVDRALFRMIFKGYTKSRQTKPLHTCPTFRPANQARQDGYKPLDPCAVPKRLQPVLPLLCDVTRRIGKRSFRALLGQTCPLSEQDNPKRTKRALEDAEMIALKTHQSQVLRFLIRALRQALPLELLGSTHNRSIIENIVRVVVCKSGKEERVDVTHLLVQRGLRVTDVPWLQLKRNGTLTGRVCNPTDLRFRQERISELVVWILRELCLPLLQQNFYVTEGETSRNRILYFRREVWTALVDRASRVMMKTDRRQFTVLTSAALAKAMQQRGTAVASVGSLFCPVPVVTHSNIRFIPKVSRLRAIQRLRGKMLRGFVRARVLPFAGVPSAIPCHLSARFLLGRAKYSKKSFTSIALEVLSSESKRIPQSLGASVFSNDEIYASIRRLASEWRAAGRPKLYFLCMDVKQSFDTVPLNALLSRVIPSVVRRSRYIVLRYAVMKRNITDGRLLVRFYYYACQEPGEESHFPRLLRTKLGLLHRGALFIDLVSVTIVNRADLLAALREIIGNNIVFVPHRARGSRGTAFARQCQGLAQGCPLSPFLTSLFYGHVEHSELSEYLSRSGQPLQVFMRQVDDSIFISSDLRIARRLASRMARGWDDTHGFEINIKKTRANFNTGIAGKTNQRRLPWCGFIMDTETLQVTNDYERYVSSDLRLRDTITIVHGPCAAQVLLLRASSCFRPKLHPIFLDSSINSRRTVSLNIFQAALLASLKLCAYAREVLPVARCGADPNTPGYFAKVVWEMVEQFCTLVRLASSSAVAEQHGCSFPLGADEVKFLVCTAFSRVLDKRLDMWYVGEAELALHSAIDGVRFFKRAYGQVEDLEMTFHVVMQPSLSLPLWNIRL